MAIIEEGILKKAGPELFKELLRVYPVAEWEDYVKGTMWRDDLMRMDLQLLYAHAREAGAPYPPPLEEMKLPVGAPRGVLPKATGAVPGVRPLGTPLKLGVRWGTEAGGPAGAAGAAGAPGAPGGPAAELRLIALFVAKWKLEPTKTKVFLAKLIPGRRRYVIQNFKTTAQGGEATAELEAYINECETTDAWANAEALAPVAVAAKQAAPAATPMVGLKRPLAQTITPTSTALDAAKRPKLAAVVAPKLAPGLIRPAGPGVLPKAGIVRPKLSGA